MAKVPGLVLSLAMTAGFVQNATNHSGLKQAEWNDPSPHKSRFISVDTNVQLEVLDWGGSGRPLVLLPGLGNTAHVFDDFAPKLTHSCHVYGITRRGFGSSSSPATGYSADRLGDDVLAVIDSLALDHPVLVGHSIGGEELSSVGTRHPEKVAGLIYLDAGYGYAYYDPLLGDLELDSLYLQRMLDQFPAPSPALKRDGPHVTKMLKQVRDTDSPRQEDRYLKQLLQADLPRLEEDLRALSDSQQLAREILEEKLPLLEGELRKRQKELQSVPEPPKEPHPKAADVASFEALRLWLALFSKSVPPEAELRQHFGVRANGGIGKEVDISKAAEAVIAGERKYTDIRVAILAVYSLPPSQRTLDSAGEEEQAKAFEAGLPSARVVRIPHAEHFVFLSNEAEVLREMLAFLAKLPGPTN